MPKMQKLKDKTDDIVSGGGNSVFAGLAGEGPVTAGDLEGDGPIARQDGDPTILSANLDEDLKTTSQDKTSK